MSIYNAKAFCAVIAMAAMAVCAARGQSGQAAPQPGPQSEPPSAPQSGPPPASPASDSAASAPEPNLTPLETIQYLNQKLIDESRIPSGMDTGAATIWPGYFAVEQSKGTLWWVRGAQTSTSGWEIRYSSVQVNQLDPGLLTLGMGHGDYEKITIKCKSTPDASSANPCWHNWVATWDDQSTALSTGQFGDLKVARVADHQDQQILDAADDSVSPLRKQILLFDGKQKELIDVEPTKPSSELEIYLGSADSDTAQRMLRALKFLLKKMPAGVTETDPFGP
jgi:hypothetical protein